jgi:signal peptidase I
MGLVNWLIVPAAIVLILHLFVFQAFHVVGSSMVPTLDQSDYLIVSKINASLARFSKLAGKPGDYIPSRGEIIVFHYPKDPNLVFVKRVIGVPGDRVVVSGGKVTVYSPKNPNGLNPDQNYQVADPVTLGQIDLVVQPGKVFVMGDNRTPNGSFDSRDWGELPSKDIIGKAVLRLLPLNKFKIITHPKIGAIPGQDAVTLVRSPAL